MTTTLASEHAVPIQQNDFDTMLCFAEHVFALKASGGYLRQLMPTLPETAQLPTQHPSMLMGFDFHLTEQGPRLIEINNNAGGLYIGDGRWMPQPEIASFQLPLEQRLLEMFPEHWATMAIMDERVHEQYMYPEMKAYARLLEEAGRRVYLLSPEDLILQDDGLYMGGHRIDGIYNRHTDFYLDSPSLAHVRTAYEQGMVELNPHPRSYALIGDKRRMVDWWHNGLLEESVSQAAVAMIREVTPETRHFTDFDHEQLWQQRKQWVFKPAARHGGKGVVLGKAMSRKRFDALDRDDTIVQHLVPASKVEVEGQEMKFDVRLYMCGGRLIGLSGRVWKGQVTNFREPGSGWVRLCVEG